MLKMFFKSEVMAEEHHILCKQHVRYFLKILQPDEDMVIIQPDPLHDKGHNIAWSPAAEVELDHVC